MVFLPDPLHVSSWNRSRQLRRQSLPRRRRLRAYSLRRAVPADGTAHLRAEARLGRAGPRDVVETHRARDSRRLRRAGRLADRRHRHLLPDARARNARRRESARPPRDHLVRQPRGRDRRAGLRRAWRRDLPRPPAQLPRELHRFEAPLGATKRAGQLRTYPKDHASGRLHRAASHRRGADHRLGSLRRHALGFFEKRSRRGSAQALGHRPRLARHAHADLWQAGRGARLGCERAGHPGRYPGRLPRGRSAEQRLLAQRAQPAAPRASFTASRIASPSIRKAA